MPSLRKLAIITSHPIQYNAPLFSLLSNRGIIKIKVFYTWGAKSIGRKFDPDFNKVIEWDIPLLDGYDYQFATNISPKPGSHHFFGCINPYLLQAINDWQPNCIMVYGWNFFSHLLVLKYYKNRLPIFFRGDSHLLNYTSNFKAILRRIWLRSVYSNIDKAFFVGTKNKEYFRYFGLLDSQLVFVPHAIDNERFSKKSTIDSYRNQLGISSDAKVILFAGKLEPRKNPELLLQAFNMLNVSSAVLVIVGNGVLEEKLKVIAFANQNIIFLPFQNQTQMPAIYGLADIFVLPSQSETWGLSVNEAMAAGCTVIASDKCGCALDLIENGVNGYIFESNNVMALSEALLSALSRSDEMGICSTLRIANWTYSNCATAIEKEVISTCEEFFA